MSGRDLTPQVTAEIAKKIIRPVLLAELDFASSPLQLWTGVGVLPWDGKSWLGAGDMGSISAITESEEISANGITMTLNGIPSDDLYLALAEPYQSRSVTVRLGFHDENLEIIPDPKQIFSGKMDVMEIAEDAEISSISIAVENRMIDLLKPKTSRYTHEDQQIEYPGDMGLEFVSDLQNKEIVWVPS